MRTQKNKQNQNSTALIVLRTQESRFRFKEKNNKKGVILFLILQNKISMYIFIVHTLWLCYIYTSLYSVHNLTHSEVENCTKTQ